MAGTSPAMTKEQDGTEKRLIDLERELKLLATEQGFRLYAERLQIWRLCSHAACRRTRACGDKRRCGTRFAEWAEAIKAARLEQCAYHPEADAFRLDLAQRIERLAQTMRDEA
ncbi:MAG: hypothetical protein ACRECM_06560 [Methyloceanibacter sp.]